MRNNSLDVEKFDGTWDFRLWKKKRNVVLVERELDASIEDELEFSSRITPFQKNFFFMMAQSVLMLHLIGNVLNKCDSLEMAPAIWKRLDDLYLVKSLPN